MNSMPPKLSDFELLCSRLELATNLSRRRVLKSLALLGLLPGVAAGCKNQEKQEQIDPATTIDFDEAAIANRPVRRNVASLSPLDDILVAYQDAVREMRRLPESDPRSWQRQAEIHNSRCPHSNWLFLPWHRHYLYWFERIIRTMSGKDDWALPYWNWGELSSIPAPFQDRDSPLFHPRDRQKVQVGKRRIDRALDVRNFLYFGSGKLDPGADRLETSTKSTFERIHDKIHIRIGNRENGMGGYHSPLDPIFWLHHAYIDYIWTVWNIGRGNRNPAESDWIDFSFAGDFFDGDGTAVTGESARVEFCLLLPAISYNYQNSPVGNSMGNLDV